MIPLQLNGQIIAYSLCRLLISSFILFGRPGFAVGPLRGSLFAPCALRTAAARRTPGTWRGTAASLNYE
jgi:hypothetical protein